MSCSYTLGIPALRRQPQIRLGSDRQNDTVHSEIDYTALTHPVAPPARTNPTAHAVSRLASENGWQYFTHAVDQQLPGVVFREVDGKARFSQRAVNIVRIPGDPMVEVGDSFYTEVAVGNQFTQQWGYAAVDLGVAVPSVTIEAVRNRARSALPATPAGAAADDSRPGVRVEAAPGSEQAVDALITPEIVDALADEAHPLDAELRGQWLFLYAPRSLSNDDATSWRAVLATVDLFVARVRELRLPQAAAELPPAAGTPAAAPPAGAVHAEPLQSRGSRVNGARVGLYLGVVLAAMVIAGGAALFFGR